MFVHTPLQVPPKGLNGNDVGCGIDILVHAAVLDLSHKGLYRSAHLLVLCGEGAYRGDAGGVVDVPVHHAPQVLSYKQP